MAKLSGHIGRIGILDLTWAKSEEDLSEIEGIEKVGVLRVPEHLYKFVCSIPMDKVGVVEPVKLGPRKELTGQNRVSGEFLAGGDPEATLTITGQLFVAPPLEEIGFKAIDLTGMMFVPRGSEGKLSSKLGNVTGQIIYYPTDKGTPRLFQGEETIGREFLELLPEPAVWIIVGQVTVDDDVSSDLIRSKVPEIVLRGKLCAPSALVPLLQALAVDKLGSVVAKEASPWGEEES